MIRRLLLCITVLVGICHADIFEKNRSLGKGINMGNMYEAPSEGAWGEMLDTNYFAGVPHSVHDSSKNMISAGHTGSSVRHSVFTKIQRR